MKMLTIFVTPQKGKVTIGYLTGKLDIPRKISVQVHRKLTVGLAGKEVKPLLRSPSDPFFCCPRCNGTKVQAFWWEKRVFLWCNEKDELIAEHIHGQRRETLFNEAPPERQRAFDFPPDIPHEVEGSAQETQQEKKRIFRA
uniref:Uncharacterized protein n=1 Tax=Sphaerodactylus townsendi TaxID=933632 RepID=A0ACB8EAQ8_9SAUR